MRTITPVYVIRKDAQVAPADAQGSVPLKTLTRGTPIESIPDAELAQLAAGHFVELDDTATTVVGYPTSISNEHVGRLAREAAAAREELDEAST